MGIFDLWRKTKAGQDAENPTVIGRRAPMVIDRTDQIKINGELTRGILTNTAPGFKLSAGLAYAPIHTPVSIIGIPVPAGVSEKENDILIKFLERNQMLPDQIHISSHGDGTIWAWPFFNSETGKAEVELILDDSVSDIVKDIRTGTIREVWTSDQITIQTGFNEQKTVERTRRFTRETIEDKIDNVLSIYKNPIGCLPIAFANERQIGSTRGMSDLVRIIPDLKAYHDIKVKWATNLTKINPKTVQEVEDFRSWMTNNGFSSIADIDAQSIDFIVNKKDMEKSSILGVPNGMGSEYQQLLSLIYWTIVQASSLPELAWGLLASGNHASTEEQMERLMSFCRKKQRQHTNSWAKLFTAVLQLESRATMRRTSGEVTVEWNRLDALSESTKAEIFLKIGQAVEKMTQAGVPSEVIHAKLLDFYPGDVVESFEDFHKQRQSAAKYKAWLGASYIDQLDASGQAQ